MKKTVPISLLLLLFFSQAGYYILFSVRQYQVKESVKKQLLSSIPESSLNIFDADLYGKEMEWEDQGREFYLHGQMYDVAFIKKMNGKTLVYCLNDKKEEQLLKEFSKAVTAGDHQNGSSKNGHHTLKFQFTDYLLFSGGIVTVNRYMRQKHIGYTVPLASVTTDINTPPPDLIF